MFTSDAFIMLSETTSDTRNRQTPIQEISNFIPNSQDVSFETPSTDRDWSTISTDEICEEAGIEYLAGYVAKKLFEKFP